MDETVARSVDLLIIGAGPGGLSTALHLVREDPAWAERLLVLEKAAHPRPKLCGGGVTRLGLQTLQELGMPFPLPIPQVQVEDVRLVYGRSTVHVRGRPQFTVFHRAELDAYLAEQARQRGVVLREDEPAQHIELKEDGAIVTTAKGIYHARAVVGADGSNGISRRLINSFDAPSRVARVLEVLCPAVESDAPFIDRFALMDFTNVDRGLQGYAWEFPSLVGGKPFFNLGVYDARVATEHPKANLPAILGSALTGWGKGSDDYRPAGHPIHWFTPRAQLARPGMLLVGDAAGVDPLFGEGIGPALAYGGVAARALAEAFARGDFSFQGYRREVLRSPVGKYLRFRSFAAEVCYHLGDQPGFMSFIWGVGSLLAKAVPPPPDLYRNKNGKEKASDFTYQR